MMKRTGRLTVVVAALLVSCFAGCGEQQRPETPETGPTGPGDPRPDDALPYWRSIREGDVGAYIDHTGKVALTTELNVVQFKGAMELFDFGTEPVARIRHGQRRWGLIDRTGKIIVEPKYEEMGLPAFGAVPVKIHGRWGLLDYQGNEVLPTRYLRIETFSEGLGLIKATPAQVAGKWPDAETEARLSELLGKLKDRNPTRREAAMQELIKIGEPLLESRAFMEAVRGIKGKNSQQARLIERITHSPAMSRPHHPKHGYINPKGEFVIKPRFGLARRFRGGRAGVANGLILGYIDRRGEFVFHGRGGDFSSGLARLPRDGRIVFVNDQGQTVIEPAEGQRFAKPGFVEGRARFKQADKYGFIDTKGQVVIKATYEMASNFSDGLALVRRGQGENRELAYIDRSGEVAIPWRKGRWYYSFKGGLALFSDSEDVYKLMNKQGELVYDSGVTQLWRGPPGR